MRAIKGLVATAITCNKEIAATEPQASVCVLSAVQLVMAVQLYSLEEVPKQLKQVLSNHHAIGKDTFADNSAS